MNNQSYKPGQVVALKSDPNLKGAVISVEEKDPESRVTVFVNGSSQVFYASQLEMAEEKPTHYLAADDFHTYMTSLQIRFPGLSTLYSLNAARVNFIPYQFRPVLRFIRSDRPRMLIADSVGVGKTIEAGLILRELQARSEVRSVLVICPKALVTQNKWRNEMKRFGEDFTHLDGNFLRYCLSEMDKEGVWPSKFNKAIVPFSLFDSRLVQGSNDRNNRKKRSKGLIELDPPPKFDLVIVDEAHHVRNNDTFSHQAVRYFTDNAEAAVFLTATPIQLRNHDLFTLLNLLRPDLVIDEDSFNHMTEPNPYINQAVTEARSPDYDWKNKARHLLIKAENTAWGQAIFSNNPDFQDIKETLGGNSDIDREERIALINQMENLHTFSGILNRTRRRDIGDFTVRKPQTVSVDFTSSQQELHDEILRIQAQIYEKVHSNVNINFLMTTIRRQTASCLFGLVPTLKDILNRHIYSLYSDGEDDEIPSISEEDIRNIEEQIQEILEMASNLEPEDPKFKALLRIIREKQNDDKNKVMIFSSFRHTLAYLYENLSNQDYKVGIIHGDIPDDERVEVLDNFRSASEEGHQIDVLLLSEIGCEGLDFEFCDCMVNYDLPWNPMRIEQRIGRIDRNGQESESVQIFNMITPGTVDADIYERCLQRIGVFNRSIGAGEEILGEISREIKQIAENFSINEEERQEKLRQITDNKVRVIQEQKELEEKEQEFFGIHVPKDQINKEIEDATNFWLSSSSLERLVRKYLKEVTGEDRNMILGDKAIKTLRLSQSAKKKMLADLNKLPREDTEYYRNWEKWLKEGEPHLTITFEAESAKLNPKAAFIMPLHPLVKQASEFFGNKEYVKTALQLETKEAKAGTYPFVVFQWKYQGIKEDQKLKPVALEEEITSKLPGFLGEAEEVSGEIMEFTEKVELSVWEELDRKHHSLWSEAREKHRAHTLQLAQFRRESLKTSHNARENLLKEQLQNADNEKIIRMRASQLNSAKQDYEFRIKELEKAEKRTDLIANPVAYGVLIIKN